MSKKKSLIVCVVLFAVISSVFGNDLTLYEDYKNGYSGYAVSEYVGWLKDVPQCNTGEELLDFMAARLLKSAPDSIPVESLSNQEIWLMKRALAEQETEKEEIFLVGIAKSQDATEMLAVFVFFTGDESYIWKGFQVSEEDLED